MVDEICWDAQCDLAKWRFEALKSRYIIINRESLLEEHGVDFPSFNALEASIHIEDKIVANATPHISFAAGTRPILKQNNRYLDDLDLLSDIEPKISAIEIKSSNYKKPAIMLAPPPPAPLIVKDVQPLIKEEPLTPLATPLVTPNQSPKAIKNEAPELLDSKQYTAEKSSTSLVYRNIVFTPKDPPLSDSLKKQNVQQLVETVTIRCQDIKLNKEAQPNDEKENCPNLNGGTYNCTNLVHGKNTIN